MKCPFGNKEELGKRLSVYDGNCHCIINTKQDILKVTLFLVKDYNFKTDAIIKFCKLDLLPSKNKLRSWPVGKGAGLTGIWYL